MHIGVSTNSALRERLEALEQELGRPIRVVSSDRVSGPWRGQSDDPTAEARGVTIVAWGTHNGNATSSSLYVGANHLPDVYQVQSAAALILAEGVEVGEIRPRLIYSFAHVTYSFSEPHIDAIIEAIKLSIEDDFIEQAAEREAQQRQEMLRTFVRTTYNRNINTHRQEIDALTTRLGSFRENIANTVRLVREKHTMLEALLHVASNDAGERVLAEWQRLEDHPRIAEMSFTSNADQGQLTITTADDLRLTREDTGESRWLGRFRIEVNMTTCAVRMHNLDTPRGGRDHPHVNGGTPCFGGHEDAMYDLLGRGEMYVAFEVMLQYLETLNLDDSWGAYGAWWFDVEDERPLVNANEAVAA